MAAKLLDRYQHEFTKDKKLSIDDIKLLLSWYAEDVMRTVEQEVKEVEEEIRRQYPQAMYIELEPDSKYPGAATYAIDDCADQIVLKRMEIKTINAIQKTLKDKKRRDKKDTNKHLN